MTSAALFRAFVDSAPDALLMVDGDGQIKLVNDQAERTFGYARDELLGQAVEILLPEPLRSRHVAHRTNFFAESRPRPMGSGIDLLARRKDGTLLPVEISLSPLETEVGKIVIAAIRDVTAQHHAKSLLAQRAADLARSNAELEQFAYAASHDLQEPLRMVSSFCQLLKKNYQGRLDERANRWIDFATSGAARMRVLIEDLLVYSRAGRRDRPPERVDLNQLLADIQGDLALAIQDANARIEWLALPTVMGEPSQLRQLFQNLISNALKFHGGAPAVVRIAADLHDDGWEFTVSDNGIGIEPAHHQRIFKIFQRLHGRDEYPGTGIGLAVCAKIVESHGGRIWVESQAGAGAAFHFTLATATGVPLAPELEALSV